MDIDPGIEPLHVIERRHIEKALTACNGCVRYAAKLLGVGRSTVHRRLAEWHGGHYEGMRQPRKIDPMPEAVPVPKPVPRATRRQVEAAIQESGGCLSSAAEALGISSIKVAGLLRIWSRDNERLIVSKAKLEGISAEEVEVMMRRRTMAEHAERSAFSLMTAYKMIDEACALVGLRRYRHWLFLA